MRSPLPPGFTRRSVLGSVAALSATALSPSWAQAPYPSKPIKLLVGYAPGGSVDMAARVVADILQAQLGATVVIENASGAAGTLAAQRLVQAPADGYTLMTGSSNEFAATRQVNPAQRYDPLKDLTPLALVATAPVLLVAGSGVGVKNLDDFIKLVKRSPGKYSYGTSGIGSTLHFAAEMIKQRAGLFITHIPYRGTAPLLNDLAGGAIEFAMISPTAAMPFIQSGRLVPLGITSSTRFPSLPQVPAVAEHPLMKGFELSGWFAAAAPNGLPPELAQRLRTALQAGLAEPAYAKRLQDGGAFPASGREDLARLMRDDTAKYGAMVKVANFRE